MVLLLRNFRSNIKTQVCSFRCIVLMSTLVILTVYSIFQLQLWGRSRIYIRSGVAKNPPPLNSSTKLILYWNTLFGEETFYLGMGDMFEDCPGVDADNCYVTNDASITDIEDFDAIMFHANELFSWDLPYKRSSRQLYIYTNLESPIMYPFPSYYEDYFNLTMTYRLDSDIPWPYAIIRDRNNGNVAWPLHPEIVWNTSFIGATANEFTVSQRHGANDIQWSKGKTKTAVWFVSHCRTEGGREEYVDEMKKYIDVDIYGRCGSPNCGRDKDCFKTLVEPNYYFYLSFENSLCQDYVTEKLFDAMKHRVVPVVYGGANYSLFAPPKSYINALDFESPQHLAKYLKMLTERPNEYAEYFKWKERYEVANPNNMAICRLCRILNSETPVRKTYNSLSRWYEKCPLHDILSDVPYITKSNIKP